MQDTTRKENKKVEAGYEERRSGHGVDGAQEEEGEDVLQVVDVSSARRGTLIS